MHADKPSCSVLSSIVLLSALLAGVLLAGTLRAQVPRLINYQGYLTTPGSSSPVNATVSMKLSLYGVAAGGAALYAETQNVSVTNGVFNVVIGSVTPLTLVFDIPYYLGVSVGADPEMTPRQPVVASPYALRSANSDALAPAATVTGAQITGTIGTAQIADNAVTLSKLSPSTGAAAGKFLGSDGATLQWLTPTLPATGFVQNTTVTQASTNFNISGNGTAGGTLAANIVNAATEFDLAGFKVLSVSGSPNFPRTNTFVGDSAGVSTAPSDNPSLTGISNSFFGSFAGYTNSTGTDNSFFGRIAGFNNLSGGGNTFIGQGAGYTNSAGSSNVIIGEYAGYGATGNSNVYVGAGAAGNDTGGASNTYVGTSAGNPFGLTMTNATAIGANASVSRNNSVVLGSVAGVNGAAFSTNVGVGATAPQSKLDVVGTGWFRGDNTPLPGAAGAGVGIGYGGLGYLFAFDYSGGGPKVLALNSPGGNVGVGTTTPAERLTVATATSNFGFIQTDGNIVVGSYVGGSGVGGWYGTKSNHPLHFFTNNSSPQVSLATSGNVGIGTTNPTRKLTVATGTNGYGVTHTDGNVVVSTFVGSTAGAVGTTSAHAFQVVGNSQIGLEIETTGAVKVVHTVSGGTSMCFDASFRIGTCGSSLRYKTHLAPYSGGFDVIDRLQPVTFDWIQDGSHDVGFGAEDVAAVEPLFVTHNADGVIEGVKYDRLAVAFVNAFKEQRAQINRQQHEVDDLKAQLSQMRHLICADHPNARLCRQ